MGVIVLSDSSVCEEKSKKSYVRNYPKGYVVIWRSVSSVVEDSHIDPKVG